MRLRPIHELKLVEIQLELTPITRWRTSCNDTLHGIFTHPVYLWVEFGSLKGCGEKNRDVGLGQASGKFAEIRNGMT